MSVYNGNWSAIAGLTALTLVLITTAPTIIESYKRVRLHYKNDVFQEGHKLYEDQDGVATEEMEHDYSAAIPKYMILAATMIGLATSIVTLVAAIITFHSNIVIGDCYFATIWVKKTRVL